MGQAEEALSKIQLDSYENFSQETIDRFKAEPDTYRAFVKGIEKEVNNGFPLVRVDRTRYKNRC